MMNLIKRLMPDKLKREGKFFLMDLLRIPYSKHGVPLEILNRLPKSKPITFFDIGANAGHFSLNILGEYKVAKGVLIEPIPALIPTLERNFTDKNTFTIINAAVSDSIGETQFYINEDFDSISSLLKIHESSDELASLKIKTAVAKTVKTLTLDSITADQQITHIDLIKIDVQGAEHLVLKSATDTLKKTKLIYTEFSFKPLYEGSSVFIDLYNFLYQNNFMLVQIQPGYASSTGELLQGDGLFVNRDMINETL